MIVLIAGSVWAYPSKNKKSDSKQLALRQNMQRMETNYFNLIVLANSKHVRFDEAKLTLEDMEDIARKIRALGVRKELDQPLKDLNAQIGSLKKEISQEDPIHLRKGIDQLYETCFRCHSLHAPIQR